MDNEVNNLKHLRKIDEYEVREWRPAPKSSVTKIFEDFLYSNIKMAEILTSQISLGRTGQKIKSTKTDRIASSFYAWRRKHKTKEALERLGIEKIILIRRGDKLALKKKIKNKIPRRKK